jgi:hypothetical protein
MVFHVTSSQKMTVSFHRGHTTPMSMQAVETPLGPPLGAAVWAIPVVSATPARCNIDLAALLRADALQRPCDAAEGLPRA